MTSTLRPLDKECITIITPDLTPGGKVSFCGKFEVIKEHYNDTTLNRLALAISNAVRSIFNFDTFVAVTIRREFVAVTIRREIDSENYGRQYQYEKALVSKRSFDKISKLANHIHVAPPLSNSSNAAGFLST